MTLESIIIVGATVLAAVSAPFVYIYKAMEIRVAHLENQQKETYSKEETKELIHDKLEVVKDNLEDIKLNINKILDAMLKK
jgi:hypothetical protein